MSLKRNPAPIASLQAFEILCRHAQRSLLLLVPIVLQQFEVFRAIGGFVTMGRQGLFRRA